MAGFLYIFSNPSIPGQLKIGKSDRDPDEYRRSELSNTSVPSDFNVEYFAFVDDHHILERTLHEKLSKFRTNPKREFFLCNVDIAISALQDVAKGKIKYEENRGQQSSGTNIDKKTDISDQNLQLPKDRKYFQRSDLVAGLTLISENWSDKILEVISYRSHNVFRLESGEHAVVVDSSVYVYESEHKTFSALLALNIFGAPLSRDGLIRELRIDYVSVRR